MSKGFLHIEPFVAHAYDALVEAGVFASESKMTPERYAQIVSNLAQQSYAKIYRITYRSDNLAVTGMLVTPAEVKEKSHPIIIYNRGGYQSFGTLTAGTAVRYLLPLSRRNNALVFASNYRGNDGSEGQEEYCGADVEDVLALLDVARSHPAWDGVHSLMLGWSRGTAMTFRALKLGARVGAAVTVACVTDFWAIEERRPVFREQVFPQTMPDFEARREEHYRERSAVCWPEALRVPLLLMHGDKDWRTDISETIKLAALLKKEGLEHEAILYPGDDHGLSFNYEDVMARIGEWMRRHPER